MIKLRHCVSVVSAIVIFVNRIIVAAHRDGHTPNSQSRNRRHNRRHHHHNGHHHHQSRQLTGIKSKRCGTPDPTDEDRARARVAIQEWKDQGTISSLSDIEIQTYVHIIHPDGSDPNKTNEVFGNVQAQLNVVNAAFSGYEFVLVNTTVTANSTWWNARYGSDEQTAMKNELRKGNSATLNIYYNECRRDEGGGTLLGYATFPSDYDNDPKDDGVGEQCYGTLMNQIFIWGYSHLTLFISTS